MPKKTCVDFRLASGVIRVLVMPSGPNSRSCANTSVAVPVALRITRSRVWIAALL